MAGRSIKVTQAMMDDAKKLVKLMGAAVVQAPCEAESQCAELTKMGLAYGTATEDMDALTFGTQYLMRGFNSKKEPITQICHSELLEGFDLSQKEFIDLCILLGCDYTHSIGGMGPVTAYKMLKECGDIEGVLEKVKEVNEDPDKKKKFVIPDKFLFEESRELFVKPDVNRDKVELEGMIVFDKPDEEELLNWLMNSKGFHENKIVNGIERLKKCQGKKNQSRLDSFFKSAVISSSKKVEAPKGKGGKGGKGTGAKGGAWKSRKTN